MRVAIIPARGGSKRIPRKNVRDFGGKPMIAWSIEAAKQSGCFDRILVSTDDIQIASVAQSCGAEVPFMRPPELSDDHCGTTPVVRHATEWALKAGIPVSEACCIYATAPFLSPVDLRAGLDLLVGVGCEYVFAVTSYAFPIQRALRLTAEGTVAMFQPEHFGSRSQDLTPAFHDAGQFYWGRVDAWIAERPVFLSDSRPVILPRIRVQDIDTLEDWDRAERILASLNSA
jgi:N-acylneuraminate cytidylyltransferase